jgi:hypothetical protein
MAGDKSEYDDDDSRADAGLCAVMAFYTYNPCRIDRVFR